MNAFLEPLIERAKQSPKSIVFPEAMNEKVLQAARRVLDMGIASPILIGKETEIAALAATLGVDMTGMVCEDHTDEAKVQNLVACFLGVADVFSEKALNRKFTDPLNYGAAMVRVGL